MFSRPLVSLVSSRPFSQIRQYATRSANKSDSKSTTIKFKVPYKTHRLESEPPMSTTTNKEELLSFFRQMSLIRRVEISADVVYRQKLIRGFLHLYSGQEAVCVGFDSELTPQDYVITAYRCHGWMLTERAGGTAKEVMSELMGKRTGSAKGKGGSMHMYKSETGFLGGNGIVGAQVPTGTGTAFALKYQKKPNVCVIGYGDGAANQGQVYEAFNLAAVHKLPAIFIVENNRYAMGTPIEIASATPDFYTRGDYVPGIQFDGMNVLQTREVAKFCIEHAKTKGPIVAEAMTYRYSGHSMSDPGTSYRTRDEVDEMRKSRDPITLVQEYLISSGFSTEEELKQITLEIKKEVEEAVKFAQESETPHPADLYTDIYVEKVPTRGIELSNSYTPK